MKILYFDLFSGCSGDMILGALLDLGADFEAVRQGLAALPVTGYRLDVGRVLRGGVAAMQLTVQLEGHPHIHGHAHENGPGSAHDHGPAGGHEHEHEHDYDHDDEHEHEKAHEHAHDHPHSDQPSTINHQLSTLNSQPSTHHHRTFAQIRNMIAAAPLVPAVRARATAIFEHLAVAEGKIHGRPPETVHFHEVGAVDSIVDIVGICLALDQLEFDGFACSAANVGSGTVRCAHGVLPVPAPATAELLRGFPVYSAHFAGELVTPTGAAVLRTLVPEPGRLPAGTLLRTGWGAGGREHPDGPNALRLLVIETADAGAADTEVAVLECNLDDMLPELVGELADALRAAGALDVYLTPVQMKKSRPGILLTLLCRPAEAPRFAEELLARSTTFGVRMHRCAREVLDRQSFAVDTPYGAVSVKAGLRRGRLLKATPEFEDCRRLAAAASVPVAVVYQAAAAAVAAGWDALARRLEAGDA